MNHALIDAEGRSSPSATIKPRRVKNKRRASVRDEASSGSSHGSIKLALKVTKTSTLYHEKLGIPNLPVPQTASEKDGENVDLREQNASELPLVTSSSTSILKSSFVTSAVPQLSSTNAVSSSNKQDAQRPLQVDEIESQLAGDEEFDFSAAISELGSFLGTWDAEKEAAKLAITSSQF
jgi:hypothetical protein